MTAADGNREHRFRTNLAGRATQHAEAGSSTARAIRAVGGRVTSAGIPVPPLCNPMEAQMLDTLTPHREAGDFNTVPGVLPDPRGFLPEARTGAREAAAHMKDLAERFAELRNAIMRLW